MLFFHKGAIKLKHAIFFSLRSIRAHISYFLRSSKASISCFFLHRKHESLYNLFFSKSKNFQANLQKNACTNAKHSRMMPSVYNCKDKTHSNGWSHIRPKDRPIFLEVMGLTYAHPKNKTNKCDVSEDTPGVCSP